MRTKTPAKTPYCSEELRLNKGLNVKVKALDIENPNVIEIGFSLYAVPRETKTENMYIESIETIRKKFDKTCKQYVRNNLDLFQNKSIIDFSFTYANLKKGYNKYVTASLFLSQKNKLKANKIKSKIRETLKNATFELTSAMQQEGFSCYKTKHK